MSSDHQSAVFPSARLNLFSNSRYRAGAGTSPGFSERGQRRTGDLSPRIRGETERGVKQNDCGVAQPRILIVANHYAVCSARYLFDALRRLDCDVRSTGPALGRHIWGLTLDRRYVWQPTLPAPDWQPDCVLVMDSDPDILDSVEHIAGGVPTIVYGVDNHVRDYRRPYIDHYFLAHRDVSVQAFDAATTWLPCAHDPMWFLPSPIPFERRAYDVALVGVLYPQRLLLIDVLRRAGLNVFAATGLVYDRFAAAYHDARVSLCVSAAGDVGQRVFETAALGTVVVSDRCADLAALNADPVHIYNTVDEAVALCRAAQTQPERAAESVAWAAPHTWDKRAAAILRWLNEDQPQRKSINTEAQRTQRHREN